MQRIRYSELKWPAGLNLDILSEVLSEKELRDLLVKYSKEERLKRRIILPSSKTIKKVVLHYLWSLIERGETSWKEVKQDFKKDFKTLKAIDISKREVKRLFIQREKERFLEKFKEKRDEFFK